MTLRARMVVSWVLVAVWACFIFFMSAHTGADLDGGSDLVGRIKAWLDGIQSALLGEGVDAVSSIAHFCEYLVFGVLLSNALRHHVPLRCALIAAVLVTSLYGITDEVHQLFVPGRACDPVDWLVDTAGAATGSLLLWLMARRECSEAESEASRKSREAA